MVEIATVIQDSKKLLEAFDAAWESQPSGQSDAKLIVLANYGDLALTNLRIIVQNWPTP